MKKFLFGTTALVAAAAISGAAEARDLKLKVGGFYTVGVAAGQYQGSVVDATDDFHILRDGEIQFTAKGTLDNGITITARFELEVFGDQGTGDFSDENWVDIETAFGTVLIGGNDDAAYNVGGIGIASAYLSHSIQDTTFNFTPADIGTIGVGDRISVHYYTPNIAGFEAGISYTNDDESDGSDDGQSTGLDNDDDIVSIGANYSNSFGDFDFAIGGGYIYIDDSGADKSEWGAGAEVGFAGFSLKGRYEQEDANITGGAGDVIRFSGGLNYETGPWNFGIAGGYEETDLGASAELEEYRIMGGVNYELGDGVTVGAGVEYGVAEIDNTTVDEDGFGGALLLGVKF